MADARELLAHITVAGASPENPLLTIPGYYAFQQFLEQLLERIERPKVTV